MACVPIVVTNEEVQLQEQQPPASSESVTQVVLNRWNSFASDYRMSSAATTELSTRSTNETGDGYCHGSAESR